MQRKRKCHEVRIAIAGFDSPNIELCHRFCRINNVLGPEQINFSTRPTPMFLEGVSAVRITEQAAKAIGLRDNQIVRGVIEDRGGILKLVLNNRDFDWRASKNFKPGDKIDFRVETSSQGRTLQPLVSSDAKPALAATLLGSSIPVSYTHLTLPTNREV